jgi:hypothetical protein
MEKPSEDELRNQHFGEKYWELVAMLAAANMHDFKRLTKWAQRFMNRMITEETNDTGTDRQPEEETKAPSLLITLD